MPGIYNHVLLVHGGATRDRSFAASGSALFDGQDGKQLQFDLQHNLKVFSRLMEIRSQSELYPWLDLVCLNAGAGFFVAGIVDSITDGIEHAKELIFSGRVKEKFDQVRLAYEKCAA
jgi:anthranilate phosphoribosyltransferase